MTSSVPTPAGSVHEYPVMIHEGHLDTFGHVNNATYLQLFEQARWDWITRGGYGLEKIQQAQRGPVVLDCALQFRREVTNRQQVLIVSWVDKWSKKVATVRQDLLLPSAPDAQHVCCSATFTTAFFDMRARRIVEPSEDWLAALGAARPAG